MENDNQIIEAASPKNPIGNVDENENKPKKGGLRSSMWKRVKAIPNPIIMLRQTIAEAKIESDKRLLRKDEQMKQDLERFQMEIEEKLTWIAFELRQRNYLRLRKDEELSKVIKAREIVSKRQFLKVEEETGLSYYQGTVKSYKKWQNSPAKHLDLLGHKAPVLACKLSKCLSYILSCSVDRKIILWDLRSGKIIKTFTGHLKRVNDCDFHPGFDVLSTFPCIISCSGDMTIRFWSPNSDLIAKTIHGHLEAVYGSRFSPDGERFVSCSEDMTIRTWSFPEGYVLFMYRAHQAPVTTISFSPSGKYLLSGSDYGERKLFLWSARMPNIDEPAQFPHMIHWTKEGLIKKIIIRQMTPDPTFWLTIEQLFQIDESIPVVEWPAEKMSVAVKLEEEDTETDKILEEDAEILLRRNDVVQNDCVTLSVVGTDRYGVQTEAKDYIPGGNLAIIVQSVGNPISQAFLTVQSRDLQFDSFAHRSGERLGTFRVDIPLPWREDLDSNGRPKLFRSVPPGFKCILDGNAFVFTEVRRFDPGGGEIPQPTAIEIMWNCPDPDHGVVVVTANVRLRNERTWRKLSYSLKESAVRVTSDKNNVFKMGEGEEAFSFDQEARHRTFWDFIRDRDWAGVKSFLEKKCALYLGEVPLVVTQRDNITECLKKIFGRTHGLVFPHPFVHRPGTTRSSVMAELSEVVSLADFNPSLIGETVKSTPATSRAASLIESEISEDIMSVMSASDLITNSPSLMPSRISIEPFTTMSPNKGPSNLTVPNKRPSNLSIKSTSEAKEERSIWASFRSIGSNKDNTLRTSKDNTIRTNQDNTIRTSKDNTIRTSKDNTIRTSKDNTIRTSKDNTIRTNQDNTIRTSKDNTIRTNQDNTIRTNKDNTIRTNKDNTIRTSKDNTIRTNKDNTIRTNKDNSIRTSKDNTIRTNKDNTIRTNNDLNIDTNESEAPRLNNQNHTRRSKGKQTITSTISEKSAKKNERRSLRGKLFGAKQLDKQEAILEVDEDAKSDEDAEDVETQLHKRQKTQYLNLPSVVFKADIHSWRFKRRVKSLARSEATAVRRMRRRGLYSVSEEIRKTGADPKLTVHLLKNSNQTRLPKWLQTIAKRIERRVEFQSGDISVPRKSMTEESPDNTDALLPPYYQNHINLPRYFPQKAGQAEKALKNKLVDLDKVNRRILESKLPTAAEVRRGRLGRFWNSARAMLMQQYEVQSGVRKGVDPKAEKDEFEAQAAAYLLQKVAYRSGRRGGLGELPGLNSHYPNDLSGGKAVAEYLGKDWSNDLLQETMSSSIARRTFLDILLLRKRGGISERPVGRKIEFKPRDLNDAVQIEVAEEKSDLEEKKDKEKPEIPIKNKKRKHAPFLGRRGSFPIVVGLQPFAEISVSESPNAVAVDSAESGETSKVAQKGKQVGNTGKNAPTKSNSDGIKITRGGVGISSALENEASSVEGLLTAKDVVKSGGLIANFHVNGFDLAHQGAVFDANFSKSEQRVVSGGGDSLIKLWDPRDGTYVCTLKGHESGVTRVLFSDSDEQCLVSASEDRQIFIWDLNSKLVTVKLRGHSDVIYGLCVSPDVSIIVSSSHDNIIKTWFLTPKAPDAPAPPRIVGKTDSSITLSWVAPAAFNEPITAFKLQWRLGLRSSWLPVPPLSIPPHYRTKVIRDLFSSTSYQFRLLAENRMGSSDWGLPSLLVMTELGLPRSPGRPVFLTVTETVNAESVKRSYLIWIIADSKAEGGGTKEAACLHFVIQWKGRGQDFCEINQRNVAEAEAASLGQSLMTDILDQHAAALRPATGKLIEKRRMATAMSVTKREMHNRTGVASRLQTPNSITPGKGVDLIKTIRESPMERETIKRSTILLPKEMLDKLQIDVVESSTELAGRGGFALRAALIEGFDAGEKYQFRVSGFNIAGRGGWSSVSRTAAVPARVPGTPSTPVPISATLTSLTFHWFVTDDGGSAVEAYHIQFEHRVDYPVLLRRHQTTYTCHDLLPGKSYRARVKARNSAGWSPYSDYSDADLSVTSVDPPDTPTAPHPVDGTDDMLEYELKLSACHGCPITKQLLQIRQVNAFSTGEWSTEKIYLIPDDVEVVVPPTTADIAMSEDTHTVIIKQSEFGCIRFRVKNLQPDTVYEVRVRLCNFAGCSSSSLPSYRAKTNREVIGLAQGTIATD